MCWTLLGECVDDGIKVVKDGHACVQHVCECVPDALECVEDGYECVQHDCESVQHVLGCVEDGSPQVLSHHTIKSHTTGLRRVYCRDLRLFEISFGCVQQETYGFPVMCLLRLRVCWTLGRVC